MKNYIKLYSIGILGILSLYLIDLPVPPEIKDHLSPEQFKLLSMVNPLLLLLILGTAGNRLAPKMGFSSYVFNSNREVARFELKPILISSIITIPIIVMF